MTDHFAAKRLSAFDGIACPRIEWDSEVKAAYLRVREQRLIRPHSDDRKELEWMSQYEIANMVVDVSWYDASDVVGIEMLSCPDPGEISSDIPIGLWVLVGRAWERAQQLFESYPKGMGCLSLANRDDLLPLKHPYE